LREANHRGGSGRTGIETTEPGTKGEQSARKEGPTASRSARKIKKKKGSEKNVSKERVNGKTGRAEVVGTKRTRVCEVGGGGQRKYGTEKSHHQPSKKAANIGAAKLGKGKKKKVMIVKSDFGTAPRSVQEETSLQERGGA